MVNDLVYDVGAHVGDDTAFYLSQGKRVIAVEANPRFVDVLNTRFQREITQKKVTVVPYAVGRDDRTIDFYIAKNLHAQSSVFRAKASAPHAEMAPHGEDVERVTISQVQFSMLVRVFGVPHYIKMDIEGAEELCLEEYPKELCPQFISVEGDPSASRLTLLERLGYTKFKIVHHPTMVPLDTRLIRYRFESRCEQNPWMEFALQRNYYRRKFSFCFPYGSSGPWGDSIAGGWMTKCEAQQAWSMYVMHHFQHPHYKNYLVWTDFHASL